MYTDSPTVREFGRFFAPRSRNGMICGIHSGLLSKDHLFKLNDGFLRKRGRNPFYRTLRKVVGKSFPKIRINLRVVFKARETFSRCQLREQLIRYAIIFPSYFPPPSQEFRWK
jgi:hypothetical protein